MRFSVELILFCLGALFVTVLGVCKNCDAKLREAQIVPNVVNGCDSTDLEVTFPNGKKVNCGNDVSILQTLLPPTITFDKPVKCKYVTVLLYGATLTQVLQRTLDPLLKPVDGIIDPVLQGALGSVLNSAGTPIDQVLQRTRQPLSNSGVTVAPSLQQTAGNLLKRNDDEPNKVGIAYWVVHNVPAEALKTGFNGRQGDTKITYLTPFIPIGSHLYNFFVFCQKDKIQNTTPGLPVLQRFNFHIDDFQTKNKLGNPIACNFLKLTVL